MDKAKINIIASPESWIEGEAIQQLEHTARLPGMVNVTGLPDLHPGRGTPIGAVFESKDMIYPHLVGNDIGCGMMFMQTEIQLQKFKLDKIIRKIPNLQAPMGDEEAARLCDRLSLSETFLPASLGTVGGGNHFAEFLKVEQIRDAELFQVNALNKKKIFLLVHSGSRGLGEAILRAHIECFRANGILADSEEGRNYITRHDHAVTWAVANRKVIA